MQGKTATTRHGVTRKRKRSTRRLKQFQRIKGNFFRENLQTIVLSLQPIGLLQEKGSGTS